MLYFYGMSKPVQRKRQPNKRKSPLRKKTHKPYARNTIYVKDIDFEKVFQLATYQSTKEEIFAMLNISQSELYASENKAYKEKFDEAYFAGKEAGKNQLRTAQFKMAQKSVPMSIFLGKQYLNQSDNPQQLLGSDLGTVKVQFVDAKDQEDRLKAIEDKLKEEIK